MVICYLFEGSYYFLESIEPLLFTRVQGNAKFLQSQEVAQAVCQQIQSDVPAKLITCEYGEVTYLNVCLTTGWSYKEQTASGWHTWTKQSRLIGVRGEMILRFNYYQQKVITTLSHPRRGITSLIRRNITTRKLFKKIALNPRHHTGLGRILYKK